MSSDDCILFYRGQSMAGTFRAGDSLSLLQVPLSEIRAGDVVVFRGTNHLGEADELAHRIIAVTPQGLIARGDDNPGPDSTQITAENLVGKVTHVLRDGRKRAVRGGQMGLLRARLLHARRPLRAVAASIGRGLYQRLRASKLVMRLWRPRISRIQISTENGPLVKYVCCGRTVAEWWPESKRFQCRKPYDLVIPSPERRP